MKVGYARVSSKGQSLDTQLEALNKEGCEEIFQEKQSGRQSDNRLELQKAIKFCRKGDTLVCTRLDRVSRSVKDLHVILDTLDQKEVKFKATEQEFDTSTSAGRLMIGLLSIVSAFEVDLKAERQAEGIKRAKARGKKWGRAPISFSDEQIAEAIQLQETMNNQNIADKFGIGRSTMLRYIKAYKDREVS